MRRLISFAFLILQIVIFVQADGFYTIVAPGTLQANYEYTVSVTLHDNPEPATIKVGITGSKFNESKTVEVQPSNTELVHFDIPNLSSGDYKLETEGVKGLIFKNSTELNFNNEQPKVYIQTDKAVYKPGDLVQYRILALDENTRPAKLKEGLNVGIRDGAGNHIKQLKDIKLTKGVYSGEFQLSEQPVLGNWMLDVTAGKESKTIVDKQFEVAKYVLPKFSVDIETAKDVAVEDGVVKMTIRSKYTYGKPVKGKATVTIASTPRSEAAEKSVDIDGKGHLEFDLAKDLRFDMKDLLKMPEEYHYYVYLPALQIIAVVTEGYTGNQQNKTTTINLEQSRYRITVGDLPSETLVDKPFMVKAFIKNLDGSPVRDAKSQAKLVIKKYRNFEPNDKEQKKNEYVYESKVDENGMVSFEVTIPDDDYFGDVTITYEKKEQRLAGFRITANKKTEEGTEEKTEESYGPLKLVMQTKEPRLGEDFVFDVKSDNALSYFVYVITGRGKMLKHEYVQVPDNKKSHTISVKPTFDMMPYAKIYAYYVKDGELKFHELNVDFKNEFENKIEITAPEQTKPGEEVTLNIKTDPESYVGLLGVDQSVLLLKSGNDFDPKKIREGLNSYETRTPYVRGYGDYPGQTSGLVTLTNANYPYNKELHKYYLANNAGIFGPPGPPGLPGIPPPPLPSAASGQYGPPGPQLPSKIEPKVEPKIRKDFQETWLFQDVIENRMPPPGPPGIPGPPMPLAATFQNGLPGPTFPSRLDFQEPQIEPKIRKDFLETWLFQDVDNSESGPPIYYDSIVVRDPGLILPAVPLSVGIPSLGTHIARPIMAKIEEPTIRKDFIDSWIYDKIDKYYEAAPYSVIFSRGPGFITSTSPSPPIYTTTLSSTTVRPFEDFNSFVRPFSVGIRFGGVIDTTQQTTNASLSQSNKLKIRSVLKQESWICQNFPNTDAQGLAKLTKKIPDTITSWVITGFSINDKTGFGMADNPTKIQVFQPFFLSTNLPYSVKRGEVISIPIVVFNYMEKALDAEVTMENTDQEYDFTEASNDVEEVVLEEKQRSKRITVPSNSGQTVSFMIRPNKVGDITLKIKAVTPLAGDAIHQKLKVEPEGVTQFENHAIFVNIPGKEPVKHSLKANIPKEAVLDSEYLEFSAVGDILGPTIKNIDKLVRMPYGCGEQNMVNFVPNILVLYYLEAIKRDMPLVAQKAKSYMESGYQRELTYKHKDGSYSAFGDGHSDPNSWLTAYVARSFIQAKKYITIDPSVIEQALEFLIKTQHEDGHFPQKGKLFHPSHQNEVGFTAFALLAFLEDKDYSLKYKTQVDKAIKYVADSVSKEEDLYALALAAVVLQKVKHAETDKLLEKLEKSSKFENELKWWSNSAKDHSNDIEVTSYMLQALVDKEEPGKLLPIIKWLVGQRNSLGGFDSTQDTVVGLQALIKFAEKYAASGDGKMTIDFEASDEEGKDVTKGKFMVDKENSLLLQTHVLPKTTRQLAVTATGEGSSLVQLSYRYNLATKNDKPSFGIVQTPKKTEHPSQLEMEICTEYKSNGDNKESNMAVMEISLPSGFTANPDKFDGIRSAKQVQRVDTKNDDTTIIIYFDSLIVGEPVCFIAGAEKSHAVAKQKPAAITVYDYYNTEERATVYYEIKSSLCDICEKDECGVGCAK